MIIIIIIIIIISSFVLLFRFFLCCLVCMILPPPFWLFFFPSSSLLRNLTRSERISAQTKPNARYIYITTTNKTPQQHKQWQQPHDNTKQLNNLSKTKNKQENNNKTSNTKTETNRNRNRNRQQHTIPQVEQVETETVPWRRGTRQEQQQQSRTEQNYHAKRPQHH